MLGHLGLDRANNMKLAYGWQWAQSYIWHSLGNVMLYRKLNTVITQILCIF
jgi:hypothetical protein